MIVVDDILNNGTISVLSSRSKDGTCTVAPVTASLFMFSFQLLRGMPCPNLVSS
jgi:hypothetical protein